MSETLDLTPGATQAPPASTLETIDATNLSVVFTTPGGIEAILARIEADARTRAAQLDISTPKGRVAIASLARTKISAAKVQIVKAGKQLSEAARATVKSVNADCAIVEARLDALRDEVRAPLDALEAEEAARVAGHEAALAAIEAQAVSDGMTAEQINERIWQMSPLDARDWREFTQRADRTMQAVLTRLQDAHAAAVEREAAEAALVLQRALEAERIAAANECKRIEREAQIAANARALAVMEAEQQAERDRAAAAKAIAEGQARERAAEDRAEAARIMAEARARQAVIDAQRAQDAAIEAERARVAQIAAAEQAEAEKRAANAAHRKRVNGEILADMLQAMAGLQTVIDGADIGTLFAKAILVGIARSEIRHVNISY